jgi:hypothetical protein
MNEPLDYWAEVIRRGVDAVEFSLRQFCGDAWIVATVKASTSGPVLLAAHAAIDIHKQVRLEAGTALRAARDGLVIALEAGLAREQLQAYRTELAARLWREMASDPRRTLVRLIPVRAGGAAQSHHQSQDGR